MTIKLLCHKLDYEHSNPERVGHENKDVRESFFLKIASAYEASQLLVPSKENASKPLEQQLTIVRISISPTILTRLPELLWEYKLPVFFIGQQYYGCYDTVISGFDPQLLITKSFTMEKVDTTKPIDGEINIYGQQCAKKKALERFARTAEDVISCEDSRLVSCYRNAAEQGGPCFTLKFNETILTSLNLAEKFQVISPSVHNLTGSDCCLELRCFSKRTIRTRRPVSLCGHGR